MTLVTGGESPKHSKWHLMTGSVVIMGAFVVTMFALERHIDVGPEIASGEASVVQPARETPAEPTQIRVASRD